MKISTIKNFDSFVEAINSCKGKVELVTNEGDRLNLKSKLSQYFSFVKLLNNGELKKEIELVCYDPEDAKRLLDYMVMQ